MSIPQPFDESEKETIAYYNARADHFFQATAHLDMSALYERFEKRLPQNAVVLDAGCGSGRDTLHFASKGFKVSAMDASSEMVRLARALTGLEVIESSFMEINEDQKYDGIWACASLLHVPRAQIDTVINKLSTALKADGVLYTSFKYGLSEEFRHGRLFNDYDQESFEKMLTNHPELTLVELWVTEDVRSDHQEKWLNGIMRKTGRRS